MQTNNISPNKLLIPLLLAGMVNISQAQEVTRPQPKFWVGVSGAANFNFYSGTDRKSVV